jgi:hypothetical protein
VISAIAGAVVLGFVWVQLMKIFTKIFIYLMLAAGVAVLIALGVYLFTLGQSNTSDSSLRWLGVICWIVAVVLAIVTFFLRKKIALTAALFKEACRGVNHNPAVYVVTLIIIALLVGFLAFWLSSFVYLFSVPEDSIVIKDAQLDAQGSASLSSSSGVLFSASYRNLMIYQVFGLLWTVVTLSAVFQHSIAGGIASWYFSRGSGSGSSSVGSPTFRALIWGFTTSFGSLAFGSLIVAVVMFINFLLEKAKQSNQTNKVLQAVVSCIQCCLGSVQALVQWINKFAFIYIAMHGDNFCSSARGVFDLMGRNLLSAIVVDVIGDFVLLVGKFAMSALVTGVVLLVMNAQNYPIQMFTIIVIALSSFLIFNFFANIINTSVDTVLICYLEDLERNRDGALHMDTELHNLLAEKTAAARASSSKV